MVSILDLCSGKWEREEMGGDYEWEELCTGWTPRRFEQARLQAAVAPVGRTPAKVAMPADLTDADMDAFVERMARGG